MSLAASTIVHTLQGAFTIATLAMRAEPIYGFTWDGTRITVGRVRVEAAGQKSTHRLVLDNGTSVYVSTDQQVISRETLLPVNPTTAGLSVLPLYLGKTTIGYPTYKQQDDLWRDAPAPCDRRRVRLVARMVYEWKMRSPIEMGMIVRHNDKNPQNCHPDNLRLEGKAGKGRLRGTLKDHLKAQQMIAKFNPNPQQSQQRPPEPPQPKKKGGNNHKIEHWEPWGPEETYDLVGVECSNFAAGEIFFAVTHGSA